jgi:hypothetical protein
MEIENRPMEESFCSDADSGDIGTVRWFGRSWNAPICDSRAEIPVPVKLPCERCHGKIEEFDQGVQIPHMAVDGVGVSAYHLDCWFTSLGIPTTYI